MASDDRPDLVIYKHELTITVKKLREIMARHEAIFNRAGPVIVKLGEGPHGIAIERINIEMVIMLAHDLARPVIENSHGAPTPVTLSDRVAKIYLNSRDWGLRHLNGIATSPLLSADGTIRSQSGYDVATGMWVCELPSLSVLPQPTIEDARAALHHIREAFGTFPFDDAITVPDSAPPRVDPESLPQHSESAYIVALLTAVCRPSLPTTPGLLISAPSISGAGVGKGFLVRSLCAIAFGHFPYPFTTGSDVKEFEARINAALIEGGTVLFIDNANANKVLSKSDLLTSILTEPNVKVRPLGVSELRQLTPNMFVAITGNGVILGGDLARRIITVHLDARTEHPEQRNFAPGFLESIAARRSELLSHLLTIWRWGRQNDSVLRRGSPLGSYETWCRWVRDPLLTLGCADPVEMIGATKAADPERVMATDFLAEWYSQHGSEPIAAFDLAESVVKVIGPSGGSPPSRQFVASYVASLENTQINGFMLKRRPSIGHTATTRYELLKLP